MMGGKALRVFGWHPRFPYIVRVKHPGLKKHEIIPDNRRRSTPGSFFIQMPHCRTGGITLENTAREIGTCFL